MSKVAFVHWMRTSCALEGGESARYCFLIDYCVLVNLFAPIVAGPHLTTCYPRVNHVSSITQSSQVLHQELQRRGEYICSVEFYFRVTGAVISKSKLQFTEWRPILRHDLRGHSMAICELLSFILLLLPVFIKVSHASSALSEDRFKLPVGVRIDFSSRLNRRPTASRLSMGKIVATQQLKSLALLLREWERESVVKTREDRMMDWEAFHRCIMITRVSNVERKSERVC